MTVISNIAFAIAGAFAEKEAAQAAEDEKVAPTTPDLPSDGGDTGS
jgi:hypothetical protein